MPAGTRDAGEEYRYTITAQADQPIRLMVESGYGDTWSTIFNDSVSEYSSAVVEATEALIDA